MFSKRSSVKPTSPNHATGLSAAFSSRLCDPHDDANNPTRLPVSKNRRIVNAAAVGHSGRAHVGNHLSHVHPIQLRFASPVSATFIREANPVTGCFFVARDCDGIPRGIPMLLPILSVRNDLLVPASNRQHKSYPTARRTQRSESAMARRLSRELSTRRRTPFHWRISGERVLMVVSMTLCCDVLAWTMRPSPT